MALPTRMDGGAPALFSCSWQARTRRIAVKQGNKVPGNLSK